jgi:hypothetical protein
MSHPASGTPLDTSTIEALRALVTRVGETRALQMLGIPRSTLERGMAGLGLRRGTIMMIDVGLERLGTPMAISTMPTTIASRTTFR